MKTKKDDCFYYSTGGKISKKDLNAFQEMLGVFMRNAGVPKNPAESQKLENAIRFFLEDPIRMADLGAALAKGNNQQKRLSDQYIAYFRSVTSEKGIDIDNENVLSHIKTANQPLLSMLKVKEACRNNNVPLDLQMTLVDSAKREFEGVVNNIITSLSLS